MKDPIASEKRIAKMTFTSIYDLYLAKVQRKGKTEAELVQVISWLTGFTKQDLDQLRASEATLEDLFDQATLNPNATLITGVICGIRVEEITLTLTRNVRYMDKLVDELANGKKMEKILRKP